jgi:zinc protease
MDIRKAFLPLVLASLFVAACGERDESHRALTVDREAAASSKAAAAKGEADVEPPKIEIPYHRERLDNGLTVIVHEDPKAPVVAVNIWYKVGSKDEKPGKTGFAHLFEHLMFNGSENYPGEYFEPFQRSGATDMKPCPLGRWTWRCGWSLTAWGTSAGRLPRKCSTSSAAW